MIDGHGIIEKAARCDQHPTARTVNLIPAGDSTTASIAYFASLASMNGGSPMDRTWYIYALIDPRTNEVRYVGWAFDARQRFCKHIRLAKKERSHKANWIKQLVQLELEPRLAILEEGTGDWAFAERKWIAYYRATGLLTNMTDGGDGTPGCSPSEETRRKMSDVHKGKIVSSETRALISSIHKGRKKSAQELENMSRVRLGKTQPRTPKATAANRGRKQTPEHIANRMNARSFWPSRVPRQYIDIDGVRQWQCSRCKEFKTPDLFTTAVKTPGVSAACRACLTEAKRIRRIEQKIK